MAVYFFDSSALVKRYVTEVGTPWVRQLCSPAAGHDLYIARITGAEIVAALAKRARIGDLTPSAFQSAVATFRADFSTAYTIVELTAAHVESAMNLAQTRVLRGYDAIQLATALDLHAERQRNALSPLTLVSADGDLNTAATAEGFTVEDPNVHP
jgi:predicted nucleic acid-binding protein